MGRLNILKLEPPGAGRGNQRALKRPAPIRKWS